MISRLIAAVLLSVSAFSVEVSPFRGHSAEASTITTPVDDTTPDTTTLDNPFLPDEANIGDCVSALPRPECGSKARGGWRQGLVFAVILAAVVVIGIRLVIALRRRAHPAG